MKELRETLERWEKIEPERCLQMALTDRFPTQFHVARRPPRLPTTVRFTAGGELQIGGGDELLAAVIEAIEARGWFWYCNADHHGRYAQVDAADAATGSSSGEPDTHPAGVLLEAYLNCIEELAKAQAEA